MDQISIRSMKDSDWEDVRNIYELGLTSGYASFEDSAPSWEQWNTFQMKHSRLVALHQEQVVGWAAITPYSSRHVYRGVAILSIYIHPDYHGKGIGKKLMIATIEESERNGIWTLQSAIFPENEISIQLHKKVGFRILGIRERVGQKNGVWKDSVLMERRSKVVGA